MKPVHAIAAGLLLAVMLLGAPVFARAQGLAGANDARTYGTAAKTFVALSPWHFVPTDSTITFQVNQATAVGQTISRTSPGGFFTFRAGLNLPDGALVTELEAVFCDTNPNASFLLTLYVQPRMVGGGPVGGPSSGGTETPGCVDRTTVLAAPLAIDNNQNSYFVVVNLGAADTSIQFASARVGYVLQVSPPPATATFNDVPTNHIFFQFIEALAAARITGGCSTTPPLYCPDDPVTRGQMAVFLSRALGLQFAP